MIFLIVLIAQFASKFITIDIFRSENCLTSYHYQKYIIEVEGQELFGKCQNYPFGAFNMIFTNDSHVRYNTFNTSNCEWMIGSIIYPHEFCSYHNASELSLDLWIIFTLTNDHPYELSLGHTNYLKFESFLEEDCEDMIKIPSTITYYTNSLEVHMSFSRLINPNFTNPTLPYAIYQGPSSYCTKEWVCAVMKNGFDTSTIFGYFCGDGDFGVGGSCLNNEISAIPIYGISRSAARSYRIQCLLDTEYTDFLTTLPKSTKKNFIWIQNWDEECQQNYTFRVRPLGYSGCENDMQVRYEALEDFGYVMHYPVIIGCEEQENFAVIVNYGNLNDCGFVTYEYGGQVPSYITFRLTDDPYFPNQMGMVETPTCEDDLVMSEIRQNPSGYVIRYYSGDYCVSKSQVSYLMYFDIPEDMSMKAVCEEGILKVRNYTSSDTCLAYVDLNERNEYCIDRLPQYRAASYQYTCFPYYCDGFKEYDVNNVCSGRGKCIGSNICECYENYKGQFCEIEVFSTEEENGGGGGISIGVIVILSTVPWFLVLLVLCCCCTCLMVVACCFVVIFFCGALALSIVSVSQRKRISKFQRLDDFDVSN